MKTTLIIKINIYDINPKKDKENYHKRGPKTQKYNYKKEIN